MTGPTKTSEQKGDSAATAEGLAAQMCRRVRELRTSRGWSLEEFSAKCGVSRSMLSQIERGQANPTLAVTLRITDALDMSLDGLMDTPITGSAIEVIRANDPMFHFRSDQDCQIRTLSPLHLEKDVEFYQLRLAPGGQLRSAAHFEGTREFLTVEKGKVCAESGGQAEPSDGVIRPAIRLMFPMRSSILAAVTRFFFWSTSTCERNDA